MSDMETNERILRGISRALVESNQIFFESAWRKKIGEILMEESRYTKLVRWCDSEIERRQGVVATFNPASRNETYTNDMFKTYQAQLGELAMLVQFREMLIDSQCTEEERKNIEYAICKIFCIKYEENLRDYI